jgi:hypothetical protein
MHSNRELIRLAGLKAALREDITRHRLQCVTATARVAQPLAWVDRILVYWRKFAPFASLAAVPLGLLLKRASARRPGLLGMLLRWAPVAFGAARGFANGRRR